MITIIKDYYNKHDYIFGSINNDEDIKRIYDLITTGNENPDISTIKDSNVFVCYGVFRVK